MKPRDYGPFEYSPIIRRPRLAWPKGERVALWVIPNIEYFSLQERPGGYGAAKPLYWLRFTSAAPGVARGLIPLRCEGGRNPARPAGVLGTG